MRRHERHVPNAEGLRQLEDRHDRRIARPLLKSADILLGKARTLGELLLRQPALKPDALGVPPNQPPHIHGDTLADYTL